MKRIFSVKPSVVKPIAPTKTSTGQISAVKHESRSLHPNKGRLSHSSYSQDGLPMARWIAFDQKTTNILRSTLAQGTRIDTLLRGPVDYALARPSAVIAVLPAGGGDSLGI